MSRQVPNITSMAESAEEERRHRTRQYLLTMAIRSACVLLMVFVRGPWLFVVAAGAIFLPWIAVVLANHVRERRIRPVERPVTAPIVRYRGPAGADQHGGDQLGTDQHRSSHHAPGQQPTDRWYRPDDAQDAAAASGPRQDHERGAAQ